MDCVEVCPVDCFYEGENMLVIHPDECIDCGVCEPECPVDAIKPAIDQRPADANLSGNLCRSDASLTKLTYLVSLGSGRRSTSLGICLPPSRFGNANQHSLAGQLPLELGDGAKQVEHEP